jgi:hypothetical protein
MSLSALSSNRSYFNCCDDIRPFISSVESIAVVSSAFASAISSTTVITTDITETDSLILNTLVVNDIATITTISATETTSGTVITTNLITTTIDSYSVLSGNDVTFVGGVSSAVDKFFWDSSQSTLYIEGDFKTRDPFITLCSSSSGLPDIDDANKDKGILFQWYDDDSSTNKTGFFGFDDSSNRFIFNSYISSTNDIITGITGDFGDFQMESAYLENIINESLSTDLNISAASDINIYGGDNILQNITTNSTEIIGNNKILTISNDYVANVTGDILLNSTNMDLSVTGGDMSLDIDDGELDIVLNSNVVTDTLTIENIRGPIEILSGTTSDQAIYFNTTNGGITLENDAINYGITLSSVSNITFSDDSTTKMVFNGVSGIRVNKPKDDYLIWIPYYKFDSSVGFWATDRSVPSNPVHSWIKDAVDETAIIFTDVNISSRTTTDKGYQLSSIFFAYDITGNALDNDISIIVTEKTFDSSNPTTPISLTDIPTGPTSSGDLTTAPGSLVNSHYRGINITTPFFINDESTINIELSIDCNALTVFQFYGCHLKFDRNHL